MVHGVDPEFLYDPLPPGCPLPLVRNSFDHLVGARIVKRIIVNCAPRSRRPRWRRSCRCSRRRPRRAAAGARGPAGCGACERCSAGLAHRVPSRIKRMIGSAIAWMNSRTRSRSPASIGSNQSSRTWIAVSASDCFVLLLVMAWSPPARERRHCWVSITRRLRHLQFQPHPGLHPLV
jgi:hypothetical protein